MSAIRKKPAKTAFVIDSDELLALYNLLLEYTRDIILFIREETGRIYEANNAAVNAYGYSRKKLLSLTIWDLRAPEEHEFIKEQLKKAAGLKGILFETVHVRKNGKSFPVEVSAQSTLIGGERVLISIVRDITERKKAEQILRQSEANMRALLNATRESFFLMDTRGTLLTANEELAKRLGLERTDQIIGKSMYDLIPPKLAKQRKKQIAKVIQTGKPVRFEDIRTGRYVDQTMNPVFDENGRVDRIAIYGSDITEFRKLEEKLRTLALTDQLTGLYNRRGFFLLAERQMKISKRSGQDLILFYIDLDGMKKINDTLGHDEGDMALLKTTEILKATFRETDIISRMGGDEFAVLAVHMKKGTQHKLIERLNRRIGRFNSSRENKKFKISLSIGIADCHQGESFTLQDLITRADKLMYSEKKRKREQGLI